MNVQFQVILQTEHMVLKLTYILYKQKHLKH